MFTEEEFMRAAPNLEPHMGCQGALYRGTVVQTPQSTPCDIFKKKVPYESWGGGYLPNVMSLDSDPRLRLENEL